MKLGWSPSPKLKIQNYELHRLCQQCDDLLDKDKQTLIVMMDSLVKKSHMKKVNGKTAARKPKRYAGHENS